MSFQNYFFLFFFEVKNGATMFHLLSSILDLEICSHHDFEVKKPFIGERRRQKTVALWVASKSSFFFHFSLNLESLPPRLKWDKGDGKCT